ncbi:MAG: gluconolaconase [Gammaproteobacteria bacterium]|nr:gluconolaconase [Gammaproteobacteria bacterium]
MNTRADALTPVAILPVHNALGEGILWDSRRQVLWWTDIESRRLYRHDWLRAHTQILDTPERVGSFGLVEGSERLITAFESGIAMYDTHDAAVSWLSRDENRDPAVRFNDGRVDRQGRFWSGTMVEGDQSSASGCLYCVDATFGTRCQLTGVRISNSLCMSPDGRQLYFADSPTRTIRVFELNEPEGTLGASRIFAQTPAGADPDGATIDADGCLWSAHWGAGCVVRYTPQGRIDRTLRVPASQPTCVCFAGPDLDVLCVTTARTGLSETALLGEPNAGDVFLYRVGAQGLPEAEYRP